MTQVLAGARLFDGTRFHDDHALVIAGDRIVDLLPVDRAGPPSHVAAGIIAPGFVDLQVNGGDGLMVDGSTDVAALRRICATHRGLGCAGALPTLITDTPAATARVIAAGRQAARQAVPGFLGLHLEGPHLDPRRRGAHDPALIRPMSDDDLARLCAAARDLPVLMVTLAPEAARPDQIAALSAAGVIVSLGHSDCDLDTARAAIAAGACAATHLYNAMSQLGHRSPGLVGAVLSGPELSAGLIADGVHVHPAAMQVALAARPDGLFLVTDCMGFAGTGLTRMTLNGREIRREGGRLTLADGTLAGADLRMADAVARIAALGATPEAALAMATRIPARVAGLSASHGALAPGLSSRIILLDDALALRAVWEDGDWCAPLS